MNINIPFNDRHKDAMLSGSKTVTSRTRWFGEVGDIFEAFGKKFIITEQFSCKLETVVADYLDEEGFADQRDFIYFWRQLHPIKGYVPSQIVCVHRFALKEVNNEKD